MLTPSGALARYSSRNVSKRAPYTSTWYPGCISAAINTDRCPLDKETLLKGVVSVLVTSPRSATRMARPSGSARTITSRTDSRSVNSPVSSTVSAAPAPVSCPAGVRASARESAAETSSTEIPSMASRVSFSATRTSSLGSP